jgi:rhodanese-related sulfurtransferase
VVAAFNCVSFIKEAFMSKVEMLNGVENLFVSEEASVRGYHVVDVRAPEEFVGELGHIRGAELATLGESLHNFFEHAKKEDHYLFVCRSGGRSTQATLLAKAKGFMHVTNLAGGMIHWNELALKTEK